MKLLRLFLFFLLFLLIAAVAIIITTPLISLERFKPQVQSAIERQTGLQASLDGPLTLQLLPTPGLVAEQFALTDPNNTLNRLAGERLSLAAKWDGVLQRRLDVTGVTLSGIVGGIDLAQPPQFSRTAPVQAGTDAPADEEGRGFSIELQSLAVDSAQLTLFRSFGDPLAIDLDRLSARQAGDERVVLSVAGTLFERTLEGDVTLSPVPNLAELPTGAIDWEGALTSSFGALSGAGQTNLSDLGQLTGDLTVRTLDLAQVGSLLTTLGIAAPESLQGQLSGSTRLVRRGDQIDLEQATLTLDHPQGRAGFDGTATLSPLTRAILGDVTFSTPSLVGAARAFLPDQALPALLLANDGQASGKAGLTVIDQQVSADGLDLSLNSPALDVTVSGSAGYEFATPVAFLTIEGRLDDLRVLDPMIVDGAAKAVIDEGGTGNFAADVTIIGQKIDVSQLTASIATPRLTASYGGTLSQSALGLAGDGLVDVSVPDLSATAAKVLPTMNALQSLDGALTARGTARFDAAGVTVDGLDATVRGSNLNARYQGLLSARGEVIESRGQIEAATASLRQLLTPLGVNLPSQDSSTFGNASVRGQLDVTGDRIQLTSARAALDETTADLELAYQLGGAGSSAAGGAVQGRINADQLNLDRYLGTGGGPSAENSSESRRLESGWSTVPVDLSGLRIIDAAMQISADQLRLADTDWGRVALNSQLRNGRAQVDFEPARMFGGLTGGSIVADASGAVPQLITDLNLDGVAAQQFLEYLLRIDRLGGIANGRVQLNTVGRSEAEWMQALGGQISLNLKDGAILGVDLAQTLQNVRGGTLNPVRGPAASTPFTNSDVEIAIQNGVGTVQTLQLLSPVFQLNGAGQIDFARRQLSLNLPVLLGLFSGGAAQGDTLPIPLQLVGSWFDPTVRIDAERLLAEALRDPERFLNLLPEGLGARDLLADAQRVEDRARQQIDQARQQLEDKAREEAERALNDVRETASEAVNQAVGNVTDEISQQIQQVVPQELQGLANQVIGQQQFQQQAGQIVEQLGGQLNTQTLEQGLNQGFGQVLENPQVQQQLQQGVQDAGQQLLRGLFGN